jgi:ferric-dicitrate binding protein FerR (iron transport regulator)
MDRRNGENLRELFERFVDAGQAKEAAEDIERGEQMLRQWPAPEPRAELLALIKAEMGARLAHRRSHRLRWFASRAAGIAAAIVIAASVWTGIDRDAGPGVMVASLIPTAIWEGENIVLDDLGLASLNADVEGIENEVRALQENGSRSSESAVDEVEMELLEIDGEFWKG